MFGKWCAGKNIWTEEQAMEGLNTGYIMRSFV